jgi:hypothetical protein
MGLKNKKGMFFTILTIVIISLFIISYIVFTNIEKTETVEKRIETLNAFTISIEKDIPRQLYVSGYRFIFVTEKNILERGAFSTDIESEFQEAFFNGTIHGEPSSVLVGTTFVDMQTALQQYGGKINANLTLTNPTISLTQEDPWHVKVTLTANMQVTDENKLALWNKTETFSEKIPIENFDDPIYIVNTNGKIVPKVINTNYTPFVSGASPANLLVHITQMRYTASTEAPSFLMRLEGNLSSNPQGIESLVNLAAFSTQGITTQQKSIVDHIYFSPQNPSSCQVAPAGLPSWVRLDNTHLSKYNVSCA